VSHLRNLFALLLAVALAATASADNFVDVVLTRTDDFLSPADQFALGIEVSVADVPGVTAVNIAVAGGGFFALSAEDSGSWHGEIGYADLATMTADIDGLWTIDISGANPSTSSITLQADLLQESDFFQNASGLSPANGSIGVAPSSSVSWVPPPDAASAFGLFVRVDSNNNYQDENSVLGTLSPSASSWDPPQVLGLGANEFSVGYYNVDASFIAPFSVTAGSIVWGDSPYGPDGYPSATPLFALGSETIVSFDVAPEPSSLALLACGALGLLVWQRRIGRRA